MKKFLSLTLSIFMLLSLASCGGTADTETQAPDTSAPETNEPEIDLSDVPFVPELRFIVTSDTHMSNANSATVAHFKAAVEQITAYTNDPTRNEGYDKLDAVAIAGDITGAGEGGKYPGGTLEEFRAVKAIFDEVIPTGTELVLAMGNHDYGNEKHSSAQKDADAYRADFESVFGDAAKSIEINGYSFITVDADAAGGGEGKYGHDYSKTSAIALKEQLAAAAAKAGNSKPIFVFQHVGNLGTVIGTSQDAGSSNSSTALYDIQKQYSNLIVFSGHTHFALNDECSIHQKDFTSINTGGLSGITRTKLNGSNITMDNIKYPQAVYVVEADEYGRVRVRMWSAVDGGFYGDTWMIDSYNKDKFVYTEDRFTGEDIFFADDAKITVENVTPTGISIKFPHVPEDSLTARAYEIIVTNEQGKEIAKTYRSLAYYKDDFAQTASVTIEGLTEGTNYTVSVYAVNPLYSVNVTASSLRSEPLTHAFTTPAAQSSAGKDLVGVTIGTNGVSATNSILSHIGTPTVKYDESIRRNVLSFSENNTEGVIYFNYAGNNDATAAIKEAFTLETYVRVDALPSTNAGDALIGAAHNGTGFSLSIEKSGRIYFTIHGDDAAKVQLYDASCAVGTYNHIAVTYDGATVTMYVNGKTVGSSPIDGFKLHTHAAYHKIYVGADVSASGADEAHSNCTVAHLSMLCEALTAEEVAARAANFTAPQ